MVRPKALVDKVNGHVHFAYIRKHITIEVGVRKTCSLRKFTFYLVP